MIALYNFLPLYCPSCGTPTRLDHADNIIRGKFKAKQALSCAICGVTYQLVDNTELFRAATASGGDLVEYILWMRNDELVCETEEVKRKLQCNITYWIRCVRGERSEIGILD